MDRCGRQTREFQQKLSTTALRHASWTPPSPIVVLADTGATTASSERPHEARRARGAPNITEASAAAGRGRGGCCGEYGGCERTIGLCLPHQRLHGGTSSFHGTIDTSSLSVGPSCRRHRTNKAKHCCECDESWIRQGFLSNRQPSTARSSTCRCRRHRRIPCGTRSPRAAVDHWRDPGTNRAGAPRTIP